MATSAALDAALTGAALALTAVARGQALDDALRAATATNDRVRAAAQDIAYTACRRLNLLDSLAEAMLERRNPAIDGLVRAALSELIDHPERAHVIVDQSVRAGSQVARGAFKGVLNAVLRRFLREREALMARCLASEPNALGYPAWWIAKVRSAWPQDWRSILSIGNGHPPMTLRINHRRGGVDAYRAVLDAQGIVHAPLAAQALLLARPRPTSALPGFAEGLVSVQDFGAQQAAPLLDVGPGMRVLDACAAPGGKAAHLLELVDCDLTALDRDAARLGPLRDVLARLGLAATVRAADAAITAAWWDGQPYDRVLLDAPCTASGVVRRHPDGKWLKRPSDLGPLVAEQRRLQDALWQVLRPGGKLLYATCSVFPDENIRQSNRFLNTHPDARLLPLRPTADHREGQLLPHPHHDGFYYALFEKSA